jgi:hypothetical protein
MSAAKHLISANTAAQPAPDAVTSTAPVSGDAGVHGR